MSHPFFKKVSTLGFGLCTVSAAVAVLMHRTPWALGILTAGCWMFLNLFFMFKLMEMGTNLVTPRHPGRMLVLAVLKFPVIYLAGYFVLKTGFFPTESLLVGLTLFMIALGLVWAFRGRQVRVFALIFLLCLSSAAYASEPHGTVHHEAVAHESAAHGEGSEHSGGHPEVINWVTLLAKATAPSAFSDFLVKWEKGIFTLIIVLILGALSLGVSRGIQMRPGRFQAFMEIVVSGLDGLVCGVIGARGRAYTPFLGSIFIYILTSNLFGLIPLQNSIMAYITSIVPITVCVFFYVQWIGITKNGPLGYFMHLCGSPTDAFGWIMAPLMFPLHVMGEFIKPLSLTFRLYGNIMSGHLLLAVFMGMGVSMLKSLPVPAGVPIHFPFLLLEILVGVIQAFVFTLLSTIYIAMMLPHDHEGSHGEHGTEVAHAKHS